MSRLLIHVEGQTEETFVNEVLAAHLYDFGYTNVSARLLGNARQRHKRGGARAWSAVRREVLNHLKEDLGCLSTTMVDYYALPQGGGTEWPGRAAAAHLAFGNKAFTIENALRADICDELSVDYGASRFVPYIMMHEFEGLLFSDPVRFGQGIGRPDLSQSFQMIRDQFATPEEINDSYITAPSKRIENLFPSYEKPLYGSLAALAIGLDTIRRECPLFRGWIEQLENWPQ